MPTYLHPGVYIEEIPSGSRPIEGVSTSITAFVGAARRGPAGEANLIGKLDDYVTEYGEIHSEDDAMGLAIQAFYLNGGGAAYVCRLTGEGSDAASTEFNGQGAAGGGAPIANAGLVVSANSVGDWGNEIYVQVIKPDRDSLSFDLSVGHQVDGEYVEDERFRDLTLVADDSNFALTVVNDTSGLVELALGEDTEDNYQDASLTGGELANQADYFTDGVAWPQVLTFELNRLGARQISIADPGVAGADQDADAELVRAAVEAAVVALSTEVPYQAFTCAYAGRRFTLTSAEDGSAASVTVHGGSLAELLRLGSNEPAALSSTVVAADADVFSSDATGLPNLADLDMTLDVDHLGDIDISLDLESLGLEGDNGADGRAIALAIRNAVRAVNRDIAAYGNFDCEYNASREFVMTSGSANARQSGLSVTGGVGTLAEFLGLDAGDEVAGRDVEQGTSLVVPVESLGLLDQGVQLEDGSATAPTPGDYASFYDNTLRKVRDVSIMVLPGQPWPDDGSANPVVSQTLAHCSAMRNRMLIIDPPEGMELTDATAVGGLSLPTTTYNVLYYPWIEVANPLYNIDTNPNADRTVTIPPSAFAAGMWAKIDGKRGVWKAPAGVETQLRGVAGLDYIVEDLEQDQLNPLGVNCIRKIPNFGSVIWGSRTGATRADPEWRYVPVRRTAIFIEQSIYNGIQWAVFEPNSHPLWSSLRANIGAFMDGLFRAGAFQGATAKEAYFVRCGLGDTMTQGDIDSGRVIVIVGFAPLKPAEFVIVRIQQKVGEQ